MGTKIYHAITPEVRDQTGLQLCGRHRDGRYQYRSVPVINQWRGNISTLTHMERAGLAVCHALAKLMRPGVTTTIYPMTKSKSFRGFGSYNSERLWLCKGILGRIGYLYLDPNGLGYTPYRRRAADGVLHEERRAPSACGDFDTLAHEMGHNTQRGGKPHGSEFREAHNKMRVAMDRVLLKGWPALDMRKLRDSVAPHLVKKAAKKKRREVAASETRTAKWTKKVNAAERNLDKWRKALAKAERMITKWEKALRHARVFLAKAQADEEVQA